MKTQKTVCAMSAFFHVERQVQHKILCTKSHMKEVGGYIINMDSIDIKGQYDITVIIRDTNRKTKHETKTTGRFRLGFFRSVPLN